MDKKIYSIFKYIVLNREALEDDDAFCFNVNFDSYGEVMLGDGSDEKKIRRNLKKSMKKHKRMSSNTAQVGLMVTGVIGKYFETSQVKRIRTLI